METTRNVLGGRAFKFKFGGGPTSESARPSARSRSAVLSDPPTRSLEGTDSTRGAVETVTGTVTVTGPQAP